MSSNTMASRPCLCSAVRQASRHLTQHYDAALVPAGIGVNQYAVLARAARLAPRTLAELAADLGMDRSTLGHLLRPLEARGLVVIAADPSDRRRRVLRLTPAGDAVTARARPLWAAAQARVLATYGFDAADALHHQLDRLSATAFTPAVDDAPGATTHA